jgi:hypothetical protein
MKNVISKIHPLEDIRKEAAILYEGLADKDNQTELTPVVVSTSIMMAVNCQILARLDRILTILEKNDGV